MNFIRCYFSKSIFDDKNMRKLAYLNNQVFILMNKDRNLYVKSLESRL